MSQLFSRAIFVVCVIGLGAAVAAQEKGDAKDGDAPSSEAAETFKVEPGPFKVEVTVDGIFEAAEVAEISIRPEIWTTFKVSEAVEQGKTVAEGDALVSFDPRKIEEEVRDLEAGQKLAQMTLDLTEKEIAFLQVFQPLDLQAAQRGKRVADEDLARFTEIDRAMSEKSARQSRKGSAYRLEYAEEELKQLKQMYDEDDLTEQTEEIILKRAQRSVESSTFYLELAEKSLDKTLNFTLPRRAETLESQAQRQDLNLKKAQETFPMLLAKKKLELEKIAYDRKKSDERLGKLQADRNWMVLRSPAAGVVYYGRSERGKWVGGEAMAKQLRPGGTISPHQVIISIVQPRPLSVRVELPEKDLRYLAPGLTGRVVPTAYPDSKLSGTLARISPIPVKSGTFDAKVEVELGEEAKALMPGMACTVRLVAYQEAEVLAVPSSAVFHDEVDEEKRYVYLVTGEGEHEKRPVVLGKHGEKKVEVLEGLKEGDEILLEKPE